MQQVIDNKKINIVPIPLEFYPFAFPDCASITGHLAVPNQKITFQTDASKGSKVAEAPPPSKKGTSFALSFAKPPSSESAASQHLFKLENHSAILMQLENDGIQLKLYLASPHVGALRLKANALLDTVTQLQELMHLVTKCQEQVSNAIKHQQQCVNLANG